MLLDVLAQGGGSGRFRSVRGACLFADISGFTALSESLYLKMGKEGSEVLTKLLNAFYADVVKTVETWNGYVIRSG